VALHQEAGRDEPIEPAGAGVDVEGPVAAKAVEVVVVALGRQLEPRRARDRDRDQPPGLGQLLHGPVDGGHSYRGEHLLRSGRGLLGRERTSRGGEDLADHVSLAGVALHGFGLTGLRALLITTSR